MRFSLKVLRSSRVDRASWGCGAFAALLVLLLSGCETFHGWAQMRSGGAPHFGTSVSLPLGSDAAKK